MNKEEYERLLQLQQTLWGQLNGGKQTPLALVEAYQDVTRALVDIATPMIGGEVVWEEKK